MEGKYEFGDEERSLDLIFIGKVMAEVGMIEQAKQTLKKALDEARKLDDKRMCMLALELLVEVLAEIGEFDRAIKASNAIEDEI